MGVCDSPLERGVQWCVHRQKEPTPATTQSPPPPQGGEFENHYNIRLNLSNNLYSKLYNSKSICKK